MIPVFLRIDSREDARRELKSIDVDSMGIELMAPKMTTVNIKFKMLPLRVINILKQEMLSIGGDAAISRGALDLSVDSSDAILIGTLRQFKKLCKKLAFQPFGLPELAKEIEKSIENYFRRNYIIKMERSTLDLWSRARIMGILNVTPDSFYDGGRFVDRESAIEHGIKLAEDGADIIDVGGESTRPGAVPVSLEEESERVIPVINELAKRITVPISIDTYKAEIARRAIDAGAQMVNDISGLQFDTKMAELIAEKGVPVVIMHLQGRPQNMQENPHYDDVIQEILVYLKERTEFAVNHGISEENIIIDPGIGFGKTVQHNLDILKNLGAFRVLGKPILVGVSRKSFIGKILDVGVEERLEGSIAAGLLALQGGAAILRVHDVLTTRRAVLIYEAIKDKEVLKETGVM